MDKKRFMRDIEFFRQGRGLRLFARVSNVGMMVSWQSHGRLTLPLDRVKELLWDQYKDHLKEALIGDSLALRLRQKQIKATLRTVDGRAVKGWTNQLETGKSR